MNLLIVIVLSLLAFGLTTFLGFAGLWKAVTKKRKPCSLIPVPLETAHYTALVIKMEMDWNRRNDRPKRILYT